MDSAPPKSHTRYTTAHEKEFLFDLGDHCQVSERGAHMSLLELYIQAAAQRSDWGEIDAEHVRAFAQALLDEVRACSCRDRSLLYSPHAKGHIDPCKL